MRNMELTTGEKEALRFYKKHLEKHGAAPTMRQLAAYMGSDYPNTGQDYVKRLREKGYLTERPVTVMRLKLTSKAKKAVP